MVTPSGKRTMDAGGVLFSARDSGSSVFLIRSGLIMIATIKGSVKTSRTVGPGCVIGEDAILERPYSYSAECLEKVRVDEYRVGDLLGDDVLAGLAKLHHDAWRDRQAAQESNLKIRLIDTLIELSKNGESLAGGWLRIPESVTHAFLSEMIGSSRSTVTAYINEWRKDKLGVRLSQGGAGMVEINPDKLLTLRGMKK